MARRLLAATAMHKLMRACVVLSLGLIAPGCNSAAHEDPGEVVDEPRFEPYADIDQGAVARRIAAPYFRVGSVDVAPDATIRMWRPTLASAQQDPDAVPASANAVERYAPDGTLEETRRIGDGVAVFHPDGDITIMDQRADDATEFIRWSSAFEETARIVVPRGAKVAAPDFYRVADDGSFTVEPGAMVAEPRFASLVATRDGGYYGVQNFSDLQGAHGHRLVRLDANHAVTAATWMLPGAELPIEWQGDPIEVDGQIITPILRYYFRDVQLVVDRDDRVWALSGAPGSTAAALGQWLGQPVDLRDAGELFLLRYSPTLELEAVLALPAANQQEFARIAAGPDGSIGVASLSIETREIEPNKTFDYNVFFAGIDRDGTLLGTRELDIDHDEQPYALAACGAGFCIAGETGTKWVDTGSQVEFAQGFIMAVAADGAPTSLSTLHGPRRNSIESLATRADGGVVFAGTTDGPITHTAANERAVAGVLGVLQF